MTRHESTAASPVGRGGAVGTVVPRWEMRSFGEHLAVAERTLARMPVVHVVESDELYLLSSAGTDLVKVRNDLLDVKHLQQVDEDGLEQWAPVLKATFPLSAADLRVVEQAWAVPLPGGPDHGDMRLDQLLEAVVRPTPQLRAVRVHKHRIRYAVHGCLAEVTTVRTDAAETRTVAVESEEAAHVTGMLEQLGLAWYPNVNFGRGLRLLDGWGAERFAVVDVGTNSVKLHVADRSADGTWHRVADRAETTRLGEGLRQSGRLGVAPMERTAEAIAHMVAEARRRRVAVVAGVGTAGLRSAANGLQFVRDVQERCGVRIDVISGEDEARLAYLAATAGHPGHGSRVVFDTGGGSSQFTFGQGDRVDDRFSVEVGAVRFTEQFGLDRAVSEETLAAALAAIDRDLGRLGGRATPDTVLGMGGAVTNLAAVAHGLTDYEPDVVQGTVLDRAEIDRQIELYRTRDADERRSVPGLQPARAEVVLAGACIVRTVLDKLGSGSLVVSDRGLRYGVLAERFAAADVVGDRSQS